MNLFTYLTCLLFQTVTPTWQTYKTMPEVDVFFRTEQCHDEVNGIDREYILLKFVNKANYPVNVKWQLESYSNNVCNTCTNDEYKYQIHLSANGSAEGECPVPAPELRIFVKHLYLPNHSTFTKFELGNIEVVKATRTVGTPSF